MPKIKLYAEEQIIRRRQARKVDRDRIRYVLAYARENGWNSSRLRKAIDTIDEKERAERNTLFARKKAKR